MTCQDCGHTFPERYGRWFPTLHATAIWLCHSCADLRRERKIWT